MIPGATVSLCAHCGWAGMPCRDWCPVCSGAPASPGRAYEGTVEETTIVRKGVGPPGATSRIGLVRLAGGGAVVARLEAGAGPGARVALLDDEGAAVARPV